MASNFIPTKQPLKYVEIPLSKFSEEVVPHHQKIFEQYKAHIYKVIKIILYYNYSLFISN